jgi:hypothetical protein
MVGLEVDAIFIRGIVLCPNCDSLRHELSWMHSSLPVGVIIPA